MNRDTPYSAAVVDIGEGAVAGSPDVPDRHLAVRVTTRVRSYAPLRPKQHTRSSRPPLCAATRVREVGRGVATPAVGLAGGRDVRAPGVPTEEIGSDRVTKSRFDAR